MPINPALYFLQDGNIDFVGDENEEFNQSYITLVDKSENGFSIKFSQHRSMMMNETC